MDPLPKLIITLLIIVCVVLLMLPSWVKDNSSETYYLGSALAAIVAALVGILAKKP